MTTECRMMIDVRPNGGRVDDDQKKRRPRRDPLSRQ